MTLVLSNSDVEALLTMPDCIEAFEKAYVDLAAGRALSRTRSDSIVPTSRAGATYSLKSMDGVVPALGIGAVRIDSDVVTWPKQGDNIRRVKVPAAPGNRYVGLVLLFSSETGEPLAIMPDGVMQRMRVGATSGLGVKHLAREDADTVALLGSGWQAGAQLMAVCAVRKIKTIRCFSPNKERREAFATEIEPIIGIPVSPVDTAEAAARNADIISCATLSADPLIAGEWLRPGAHLDLVGGFTPAMREADDDAVKRARVFVDTREGAGKEAGDIVQPIRAGVLSPEAVAGDLFELARGTAAGRRSDDEITLFKSVGTALEDLAAAILALRRLGGS